ncbi:MAG: autotransporter outer membrane beta-barrel domain-containing protein [Serratia sp. (in: enterobacteria)]|uniref:autotransporter outer membrane beta-barrel domain-containing protein n=1 Tax=Serratia sp. (in: enterobacteria) TaxID=616 RepID=UPI003F35B9B7
MSSKKTILPFIILPLSLNTLAIDNINEGETVTVAGNQGSPEEALNFLINGTLNIGVSGGAGGEVESYTGVIGSTAGSHGRVVVTGNDSLWNNQGFLYVGHTSNGSLLIREGGTVTNYSTGYIGFNAPSQGTAEVTGVGSTWNTMNNLIVGRDGAGTLIVADGGTVNTNNMILGQNAGSSGVFMVGGDASTAPGMLVGRSISVGQGTGSIILNHKASDFVFDSTLNGGVDNATGSGTGLVGHFLIDALDGRTIFNNDHGDFTGTLQARNHGILSVNGNMSGADVMLLEGGKLEGTGRVGNTTNGGTIAPGNSIGTLTVDGNYHGNGGTLLMESVLDGDNSPTDRLMISGSATGDTQVKVVNLNGEGALTQNGIPLIYAAQFSDGNAFTLNGDYVTQEGEQAVIGGAYAYALRTMTYGEGRWWYLTSDLTDPQTPQARPPIVPTPEMPEPGTVTPGVPVIPQTPEVTPPIVPTPEVPEPGTVTPGVPVIPQKPDINAPQRYHPGAALYEQYPQILAELNRMPTLQERVGDMDSRTGAWGRMEGNYSKNQSVVSTTGAQRKMNLWTLQTGVDGALLENDYGLLTGGINFRYGKANASINAYSGSGDIDTTGYGPGLTLTWLGDNGLYLDSQAHVMFFDSSLHSATLSESLASGNKGKGYAGSLETGWRLDVGNGYSLTPQAQIVWSRVDFDGFEDKFGTEVSLRDGDSLLARAGIRGDKRSEWQAQEGTTTRSNLHVNVDVYQEMAKGTSVNVADVRFSSRDARTQIALSAGGTLDWADGRYAVYGNVGIQASPHNPQENYGAGGNIGLRISW